MIRRRQALHIAWLPTTPSKEEIRPLIQRGNDFNRKARRLGWYKYVEVYLANGKFLDGYTHGSLIVSRKATTLSDIKFSTFEKYINELLSKYCRDKIIKTKKGGIYNEILDKPLSGEYRLEIPDINLSNPRIQDYIDYARSQGVELFFRPE